MASSFKKDSKTSRMKIVAPIFLFWKLGTSDLHHISTEFYKRFSILDSDWTFTVVEWHISTHLLMAAVLVV